MPLVAQDGTLMAPASQSTIVRYWEPMNPGTRPQADHAAPVADPATHPEETT